VTGLPQPGPLHGGRSPCSRREVVPAAGIPLSGVIGAALTLIDLDVQRLPDMIVLPSYPIVFVLLLVPTMVTGQWGALVRTVLAGLGLYVGALVLVSPGGWAAATPSSPASWGCCWVGWAGARRSSRSSRPPSQVAS
jgi:hypothetical protein